jgi:hypothetical protein
VPIVHVKNTLVNNEPQQDRYNGYKLGGDQTGTFTNLI